MENFEEASLEEVNQLLDNHPAAAGEDVPLQLNVVQLETDVEGAEMTAPRSELPEIASLNLTECDKDESQQPPDRSNINMVDERDAKVVADVKDLTLNDTTSEKVSRMETVSLSDVDDDGKDVKVIVNDEDDRSVEAHNSDYLLERIRELKEEKDQVAVLEL
jgi:hypothetical protein